MKTEKMLQDTGIDNDFLNRTPIGQELKNGTASN
jgi:hypothetical protein